MREIWRERKKEGRNEAVETNAVHSGLFEQKIVITN